MSHPSYECCEKIHEFKLITFTVHKLAPGLYVSELADGTVISSPDAPPPGHSPNRYIIVLTRRYITEEVEAGNYPNPVIERKRQQSHYYERMAAKQAKKQQLLSLIEPNPPEKKLRRRNLNPTTLYIGRQSTGAG